MSELLFNALASYNIEPPKAAVSHDKFTRWGKSNQFWAKAVEEGFIFGDYSKGLSESVFPKEEKKLSKEEWRKRQSMIEQSRKEAEAEQLRLWETAAERAKGIWDGLRPMIVPHPYLTKKKIGAHGARYDPQTSALVLPLRDETGKLWSLQYISEDGSKRFLPGGRKKGCYFSLGAKTEKLVICEGYATGASIHEATGHAIAIAFDAGNLLPVAEALRGKFPDAEMIIAADNDIKTDGSPNIGVEKATAAAEKIDATMVIPELKSGGKCDFNDLTVKEGSVAVKSAFKNLSKPDIKNKLPDGFILTADKLLFDDGENPVHISSRIDVLALTRGADKSNWGMLILFKDKDGNEKRRAIPKSMLAGDCRELREQLLNDGLFISSRTAARNKLVDYLNLCKPQKRALCTDRTGWNENVFVFPNEVIGSSTDEIWFQSESRTAIYGTKGTLDGWKNNIASLCVGNSRLLFGVSLAFASLLLNACNIENGGFNLVGNSSSGKSTIQKVAASVFGGESYFHTWRATDNGLEGIANAHNDTLLLLDEIGQVDSNKAGEIAYMLANGIGKTRANKNGQAKSQYRWRLLLLSSGEINLATHLAEGRKTVKAGQEVRLIDIPAVPNEQSYGAFEHIHGFDNGKDFADMLCNRVKENYGHPAVAFIREVIGRDKEIYQDFKENLDHYSKQYLSADADGQVQRAFTRFMLVGYAGEYASSKGLTGWEEGIALAAAIACFNDWIDRRGGMKNSESKAILSQVKLFFEQHADSRFAFADQEVDAKTINMAGYKRKDAEAGELKYLVHTGVFKTEIARGFDKNTVIKELRSAGWLQLGADGKSVRNERAAGKVAKFYVFNSKMWGYE